MRWCDGWNDDGLVSSGSRQWNKYKYWTEGSIIDGMNSHSEHRWNYCNVHDTSDVTDRVLVQESSLNKLVSYF